MDDASTAYILFAPACAAKKDKIPDPAPTSNTTLSLNEYSRMNLLIIETIKKLQ